MSGLGTYFKAMAAGLPYTPPPSLVDTKHVFNASGPGVFETGGILSQAAALNVANIQEQNGGLSDKEAREEAAEAFQQEFTLQTVVNQIATQFRGIQNTLRSEEAMRYQGLMEEQSTIDMEIRNTYEYKNSIHDTVMIDDEGNVYISEDDMDGNYTHYRVNPDGTKEIDPDAEEKIASGKLRGVFFEDDHFKFLDGTRLSDQQVSASQQILHSANTSLEREARMLTPAKLSVDCHDAREEAVNADGKLETLQHHHVTITEDNASDIFLDTQEAKLKAVEARMNYAMAMAKHEGNPEKAAGAERDLKNFQAKKEEFTQFRIEAGSLAPLDKASLLEKTFDEEWSKFRSEKLQPMSAAAPVARQSSTPAPAPAYGERTAASLAEKDGKGIKSDLKLLDKFNIESHGQEIQLPAPDSAQQPPAPAVRMLSGPGSQCA